MKPYIIADTTYNHEGDIDYLMKMIDELAGIKINAVKFHLLFNIDDYMDCSHPSYEKIKKMLIPEDKWDHIIEYATARNLDVVLLCDDAASMRYARQRNDISEIEVHSSGINDTQLLKEASLYNGHVMLGVGGASVEEIRQAMGFFKQSVVLMYGFNGWPTNPCDISILRMRMLHRLFCTMVGYADHTQWDHPDNLFISCAAGFNGFPILEKHFTLTPGVPRVDFKESVGREMLGWIRDRMSIACSVYGDDIMMSDAEKNFAMKIRKVDGKRR